MFITRDIGIDLGTASVLVYVRKKGIVLREPSVVAVDNETGRILAIGEEARRMLGRTPGRITAIRPLKDGVISDYDITERMLRYFLKKVTGSLLFVKPRVIVCVPSGVTGVEKRAVLDATYEAGAKSTYLIEEPIAAAIGAEIEISKACGNMIIDIGGGTTDIAIISLGGPVVTHSIKVAGDKFDDSIIKYMRKKHNILIGERTAERMKIEIGTAFQREEQVTISVTGRNLISGLPKSVEVSSAEMIEALEEPVQSIVEAVHLVLERTPPELASDISENGAVMTGGGALLYGLDKLLRQEMKIPVHVADDAISCVAYGTGKALENIDLYENTAVFSYKRNGVVY